MDTRQEGLDWRASDRKATFVNRVRASVKTWLFPDEPTYRSAGLTLFAFAFAGGLLAIFYLVIVKPSYTATMILGPTQEQFSSSPSNQLDRNAMSLFSGGGLLSGPRVITPYDAYLKILQSHDVAERLYKEPSTIGGLFPGAWDEKTKTWRPDTSLKTTLMGVFFGILGRKYPTTPTVDSVANALNNRISVTMIDRGPMYQVSFSSTNRAFAVAFLQMLFSTADTIVKEQNRVRVLREIQALKARMASLDVMEYRSDFIKLLMEQEKQLMVLQGNNNYAATIVTEPSAPGIPDNPRVFSTIILFLVFFFLLGASALLYVYRYQVIARLRPSDKELSGAQ